MMVLGWILLSSCASVADDGEGLWLVRHARFEQALERPGAARAQIASFEQAYDAALDQARAASDPASKALALGRALAVAPESEAVRTLLAALPEQPEPYALIASEGGAAGPPALIYWARDASILALVAAGEFLLGSAREDALPEEQPQRKIRLGSFYIDRYEVSNRRYATFVARTNHASPPHWKGPTPPPALLDLPVTWVSHEDAVAYARWAGLRLPTEIEWEKAARGTDGRTYPWGENPPAASLAEIGLLSAVTPAAIASHPLGASPYGCLDMSGNVIEWTLDCYLPYRYRTLVDGSGTPAPAATGNYRVLRGGAFVDISEFGRTTFRSFQKPESRTGIFGFRVVRDG